MARLTDESAIQDSAGNAIDHVSGKAIGASDPAFVVCSANCDAKVARIDHAFQAVPSGMGQSRANDRRSWSETPFLSVNGHGQRSSGYIDRQPETDKGAVNIDHESFFGEESRLATKALSYSGQPAAYRETRHPNSFRAAFTLSLEF
jgi:hypothetical protein